MARPALWELAPLVLFFRALTVENVNSNGFVVRRCIRCSAGKSKPVNN